MAPSRLSVSARLALPPPPLIPLILSAAPGHGRAPGWWTSGTRTARCLALVVSPGALSFNSQVRAALQAADRSHARGLALLAPAITDEALVTLLVNDLAHVLPSGVVPLELTAAPDTTDALLEQIAVAAGGTVWDGRPSTLQAGHLARLSAKRESCMLTFQAAEPSPELLGALFWRAVHALHTRGR